MSRLFVPASTNYIINPSAAANVTDGWAADGAGMAWSRVRYPPLPLPNGAPACFKGVVTTNGLRRSPLVAASPGDVWTASCEGYKESGAGGPQMCIVWVAEGGGVITQPYVDITSTTGFERYSLTETAPALTVGVYVTTAAWTAWEWTGYMTQFMLEKSPYVNPYFDGSREGCSWADAANNSNSIRSAAALSVPLALGSAGFTIAGVFSPLWAANDGLAHSLLALGAGAARRATLYKSADNKVAVSVTDGVNYAISASAAQTFAAGTTNSVVARFAGPDTVDLMLNGVDAAQYSATTIGARPITEAQFEWDGTEAAYMGPWAFCPSRLSDADAATLCAGLTAGWTGEDLARWFGNRELFGVSVMPLEVDSVGYTVQGR